MHEVLIKYINDHSTTPLRERDIESIKNLFIQKKIRKRQYFLQVGEVCKFFGFIVKGAMRQYTVDDKGVEHIIRLLVEKWWAVDRESYINLTPSSYYIDAWEETDVLLVTKVDYAEHLSSIPAMKEMSNRLDENHAFAFQKRVNAMISLPIEERYADLEKTYPEFLQRFPQHIIASYLGVSRETLSRARNHNLRK